MMSNDITEWIDTYWRYVDDGYSYHDALASTCVRYGLSSYDEETLKEAVK